jgi:hypothetical protein
LLLDAQKLIKKQEYSSIAIDTTEKNQKVLKSISISDARNCRNI